MLQDLEAAFAQVVPLVFKRSPAFPVMPRRLMVVDGGSAKRSPSEEKARRAVEYAVSADMLPCLGTKIDPTSNLTYMSAFIPSGTWVPDSHKLCCNYDTTHTI